MSYKTRFVRSAKEELRQCYEDYPCLKEHLEAWLTELASCAERHDETGSWDISELPSSLASAMSPTKSSWAATQEHLGECSWMETLKAIVELVRRRKPPWQLRASWRVFSVLNGAFHCMIVVFYDVDHVSKQIVVRLFDGLPGQ